jgi:glycyl-tRNA synthetase (class II)
LEDRAVTLRDRDSMAQERVAIDDLLSVIQGRLI